MRVIENRGDTDSVHFDDLSGMYGLTYGSEPAFDVPVDSAAVLGRKQLEKLLLREEVRYSAVYMDCLLYTSVPTFSLRPQLQHTLLHCVNDRY